MRRSVALLASFLILLPATPIVPGQDRALAEGTNDLPARRPSGPMKCEPKLLTWGDTLRVTLPFPHGPYFTIRPPGAPHAHFLILTAPYVPPAQAGDILVSGEQFEAMRTINLVVASAMAETWSFEPSQVKIFSQAGKYLLEVGDQFATEAPLVEGYCTVEFRH